MVASLIAGVLAGASIGAATRIIETSRIAFGPYALYGNGALAVPQILGPVALFAGWMWLARRGATSPGSMALFAAALALGTGVGYGVAALNVGAVVGGILGYGLLFIAPVAAVAGLIVAVLRATGLARNTVALWVLFVTGAGLGSLPPLSFVGGLGTLGATVGAGLVACDGASTRRAVAVGSALAALAVLQAFALPVFVLTQGGGVR